MPGFTAAQIAQAFSLQVEDSQAQTIMNHLHVAHDLEFTRSSGVKTYVQIEAREALIECRRTCKKPLVELSAVRQRGTQHLPPLIQDPRTLKRTGITDSQKVEKLRELKGLMTVKDIAAKHGRTASERRTGTPLVGYLKERGLQPVQKVGRVGLFDPDEVKLAVDRLREEQENKQQNRTGQSKGKKEAQEKPEFVPEAPRVEQACTEKGLVASHHIAERYGENKSQVTRQNFMAKLKKHGLQKEDTCGRVLLYRPEKVDEVCRKLKLSAVDEWKTSAEVVSTSS